MLKIFLNIGKVFMSTEQMFISIKKIITELEFNKLNICTKDEH